MAKKRTPQELERIRQRKEFVQSNPELDPAEARKRFFVQTRVQELEKSGVEVTKERRAALRQKFLTGGVQRQGFYTPQDIAKYTGGNNNDKNNKVTPPPAVKQTGGYMNPNRGKDVTGFKEGQVQKSTKKVPGAIDRFMERNVVPPIENLGETTKKFRSKKGYIPVVSDVAWVGEQINKVAKDTAGSMAATFTNPTINAVAGLFGKKPNLREAGPLEATINTVGTILDIASAGGSKPVTTALSKSAQKASQSLLKKNMVGAATAASNVARKSRAAIEAAESLRMFPKVSGLDNLTSPTTKAPSKTKVPGEIGGVKFVKTKPEPEFISGGLDSTPTFKNPVGAKTPRRKKVTITEVPGGPAVSTKTGKPVKARKPKAQTAEPYVPPQTQGTPNAALQAQLQAQADQTIEVGLKNARVVKDIKTEVAKKAPAKKAAPTKKSVKLTPEEQPYTDRTPSPAGQQFKYPPSPWEARTQRQAQARTGEAQVPKSLADVKSAAPTPVVTPKTRPQFRTVFTDQKDFNEFMASGGESVVKSQTLGVQDTFIRKNQQFIAANKRASAARALAAKVSEAKRKAEVTAINEANGFVRTVVPKSQQALRQPVKKTAPVKKAAAKKAAPAKKAAKKSGSKQPTALANLLNGRR